MGKDDRKIDVGVVHSLSEARALTKQWAALADDHGRGNPFVHPDWLMTWAERFVHEKEQIWLFVARREGKLVGVAPYYRRSWGGGLAHSMHLWGTGRYGKSVELPALLVDQDQSRAVLRSLVGELCNKSRTWDWAHVPLSNPFWFEPDWLPKGGSITVLQGVMRACVIRPTTEVSLPVLKRNVRESLRRARNRLDRAFPGQWRLDCASSREEVVAALSDLASLHSARSRIPGKEIHLNVLSDNRMLSFLTTVLEASSERGGACIYRLVADEKPIAALLVLRTRESSYLSLSGMCREAWDFSPVTLLQGQAIDDATKLGQRFVNLSVGPNAAKMRWSEQMFVQPEFLLVPNRPRSVGLFSGYRLAASAVTLRHELNRHKLLTGQ